MSLVQHNRIVERVLIGLAALVAILVASPGSAIEYRYDALNRLTGVTYDDGTVVTYAYDRAGNRLSRVVSEDRDGDGVWYAAAGNPCVGGIGPGCEDNCPGVSNADQLDRGGIGVGSPPDGIGDACQCGDVSGDGRVTMSDAIAIRRSLLNPPTAVLLRSELCDVGGSAGCSLSDAVILQRSLLSPPTAAIRRQCGGGTP